MERLADQSPERAAGVRAAVATEQDGPVDAIVPAHQAGRCAFRAAAVAGRQLPETVRLDCPTEGVVRGARVAVRVEAVHVVRPCEHLLNALFAEDRAVSWLVERGREAHEVHG